MPKNNINLKPFTYKKPSNNLHNIIEQKHVNSLHPFEICAINSIGHRILLSWRPKNDPTPSHRKASSLCMSLHPQPGFCKRHFTQDRFHRVMLQGVLVVYIYICTSFHICSYTDVHHKLFTICVSAKKIAQKSLEFTLCAHKFTKCYTNLQLYIYIYAILCSFFSHNIYLHIFTQTRNQSRRAFISRFT